MEPNINSEAKMLLNPLQLLRKPDSLAERSLPCALSRKSGDRGHMESPNSACKLDQPRFGLL